MTMQDVKHVHRFSLLGLFAALISTFLLVVGAALLVVGTDLFKFAPSAPVTLLVTISAITTWAAWSYLITGRRFQAWAVVTLFLLFGAPVAILGLQELIGPPARYPSIWDGTNTFLGMVCMTACAIAIGLAFDLLRKRR